MNHRPTCRSDVPHKVNLFLATQVDHTFEVRGVGSVVSGMVIRGKISVSAQLLMGPTESAAFTPVNVTCIQRCQVSVRQVEAGERATLAIHSPLDSAAEDRAMNASPDLGLSAETRAVWRPCIPDNPYDYPLVVPGSQQSSPDIPLLHEDDSQTQQDDQVPFHEIKHASEHGQPMQSGGGSGTDTTTDTYVAAPSIQDGSGHASQSSQMAGQPSDAAHDSQTATSSPEQQDGPRGDPIREHTPSHATPLQQEAFRIPDFSEASLNQNVSHAQQEASASPHNAPSAPASDLPATSSDPTTIGGTGQEAGEMEWLARGQGGPSRNEPGEQVVQPQQVPAASAASPLNPPRKVRGLRDSMAIALQFPLNHKAPEANKHCCPGVWKV